MASWGLAKDEFVDTDHWPHQLYVREARRMLGAYVMTQADIMDDRTKADSVGLGSYNTDSHHVQRVVQPDGSALNEGDFQVRVRPYAIPYRSLVPAAVGVLEPAGAGLHVGLARGLRDGPDGAGLHDPRPGLRGRRGPGDRRARSRSRPSRSSG